MTEHEQRRRVKEIAAAYNSGDTDRAEKLYMETLVEMIARPLFPSALLYRDIPEFLFRDTSEDISKHIGGKKHGICNTD